MRAAGDGAGASVLAAYRLAARLAQPAAGLLLELRRRRGKEDGARRGERLGEPAAERPDGPLAWVHAASVGETNAVLPLIARLTEHGLAVLLTTGTLTSAEVAGRRLPPAALHQFAPLDAPGFVGRFLDHWRPGLMVLVESELWPTALHEASRRGIHIALVNGRMSDRSFRRWSRLAWVSRALLKPLDLCLAQSAADGARFAALGARTIKACGNLKFDAPPPAADEAELQALRAAVESRPVLLAASTHPGEEAAAIEAHAALSGTAPALLTIVVPRHPQRGAEVAAMAARRGLMAARRATGETIGSGTEVYVADTVGEMGLWYRLAGLAFLGGSLVPHGGQSPIEAAKLGVPVLHGPHVGNFAEVYGALGAAGAVLRVESGADLAQAAARLLQDAAERQRMAREARASVERFTGALERTWEALAPLLPAGRHEA